jgi:cell wall-associated NlpC family hydrolase
MRLPADVSDLVGIPYKVHGRDESGLDCFGLILLVACRNGTPIPDVWYKGFAPSLVGLAGQMNVEKTGSLQADRVIEMEKGGRLHLGYSLDDKRMIHATMNEGVIIENIGKYPVKGYWKFK